MNIIRVDKSNIEKEHICCAISDKKSENCVASKKVWMKDCFNDGLIFKKLDVRGKVFIEYIPAENAWIPVVADDFMFIDCFWVSGQYKGQGNADLLLNECIADSREQNKKGIVVLSSKKKMPFLSDPNYLKYKGFKTTDTADPYFELLSFPFSEDIDLPRFKECAKKGKIEDKGLTLYYSNQCPHTEKYVPIISDAAKIRGVDIKLIKFQSKEEAQNSPSPFTTYSLFFNQKFITNEIMSEQKFIKFLDSNNL